MRFPVSCRNRGRKNYKSAVRFPSESGYCILNIRASANRYNTELDIERRAEHLHRTPARHIPSIFRVHQDPTRVTAGTTSFIISSHLPPVSASNELNPVMLPPGLAMLSTYPAATGSVTAINTMGIFLVADRTASNPIVLLAMMRSGAKSTSSLAYWLARLGSPPDQRNTSEILRPSAHHSVSSAERKPIIC
jgi:hypothetical protein